VHVKGWRSACLAALVVAGSLGVGFPAGAAGDAGLTQHIIANPVPGWKSESAASLDRFVTYINGLESSTIGPEGGTAVTAAQGWHSPSGPANYVLVALVALTFNGQSRAAVQTKAKAAVISALASLCAGAPNQSSVQTASVASVPGSHQVTCTLGRNEPSPDAVGWSRSNAVALVVSVEGALTTAQLSAIALSQYNVMPSGGFAITTGHSTSWVKVVGLVFVVLAAGALFFFVVMRARSDLNGDDEGEGSAGGRGGRTGQSLWDSWRSAVGGRKDARGAVVRSGQVLRSPRAPS
jgi:hypothetical protein